MLHLILIRRINRQGIAISIEWHKTKPAWALQPGGCVQPLGAGPGVSGLEGRHPRSWGDWWGLGRTPFASWSPGSPGMEGFKDSLAAPHGQHPRPPGLRHLPGLATLRRQHPSRPTPRPPRLPSLVVVALACSSSQLPDKTDIGQDCSSN